MMIPDYAAAGAFEGERKPRRSSGLSASGWKKMFAGGATAPAGASSGNNVGILGMNGSKVDDEEIHMGANLLSGEGNDVLWYKGMGRDGLWVSGA
jgi:xanthine/uracil permease